MARVTVEDCLEQVENRFALVLIAAQRTRQIIKGAPTLLDVEKDNKEAVIALREVAAGLIPYDIEAAPTDEEVEEAIKELQQAAKDDDGPEIPAELFASLRELGAGEPPATEPAAEAPAKAEPAKEDKS
jgi:DNA-directed RNA polymerase subunit omega